MATQVLNDANVIRIINGENILLVHKAQVRTIDTLRDCVRIDIGEGALHHIYIKYGDVNEPLLGSLPALRDAIKAMLRQEVSIVGGGLGGDATAANQLVHTSLLTQTNSLLKDIKDSILWLSNDVYSTPLRIDESYPNIVYYGYAVAGSEPYESKWAIKRVTRNGDMFTYEWANGAQTFINTWDMRVELRYKVLA